MISDLLLRLWHISQQRLRAALDKVTPENARYRPTPRTASAGFIFRHVAETQLLLAKLLLGTEAELALFTRRANDEGRVIPLEDIRDLMQLSAEKVSQRISETEEEYWTELLENQFGIPDRIGAVAFLIHHSMYHTGRLLKP